jgi:hypothetical protein
MANVGGRGVEAGEQMRPQSDWAYLKGTLKQRTREPAKELPFIIYVFLAIILFGGLGIWTELLRITLSDTPNLTTLITAVMTFFPAMIGATSIQLILASSEDKVMVSFALLILCCFLTAAILLPFFSGTHPVLVLVLASLLSVIAVWVWWITNSEDPTYRKKSAPDAASGGPTSRPLTGSVAGFEV